MSDHAPITTTTTDDDGERRVYGYRELNGLDRLEVDHLCSLYTIELSGEALYAAIAERVDDERAATLLRNNGTEEASHARRIARAIAHKLGTDFTPTDAMRRLPDVRLPDTIDEAFLEMVIQGEFDGDAGYQRWADNEPDPEVQRLLRLNGREETLHGNRVRQVLEILAENR